MAMLFRQRSLGFLIKPRLRLCCLLGPFLERGVCCQPRRLRGSPLPVAQGIPVSLPTRWKGRQANRAMRHLDFSGCREHGLQGRFPAMGGAVAGWRLRMRPVVRERTATTHSNARLNLLPQSCPGNPSKTFYSPRPTLLLPRIIRRVHVVYPPRAYTMNLDFGFLASPGEVIRLGLVDYGATGG
jgi:hypothetical protein